MKKKRAKREIRRNHRSSNANMRKKVSYFKKGPMTSPCQRSNYLWMMNRNAGLVKKEKMPGNDGASKLSGQSGGYPRGQAKEGVLLGVCDGKQGRVLIPWQSADEELKKKGDTRSIKARIKRRGTGNKLDLKKGYCFARSGRVLLKAERGGTGSL